MDLKTAHDHPAVIIQKLGAAGLLQGVTATDAGTILYEVEAARGVTFAALDNDALDNLRGIYVIASDTESELYADMQGQYMATLLAHVNELLGFEEV